MWICRDELVAHVIYVSCDEISMLTSRPCTSISGLFQCVRAVICHTTQSDNHDEVLLGTAATDRIDAVNMIIAAALTPYVADGPKVQYEAHA